jgi:DNA-binding LytR/AlgR family response regulator
MRNPVHVLVIEDNPSWQKIITKSLKLWDCTIIAYANNLDEAITVLDRVDFDIALIDIYLEDKPSGLVLGKLIRQKYNKPFIFLTSGVDPKLMNEAMLTDSSSYLTKPFSPESLFMSMKSAVNQFNGNQDDATPSFFFVKNGKHLKRIEWRNVVCLRSDRNYTQVITKHNELYMIRSSLNNALSILIPAEIRSRFAQINRAEALQIDYIKELTDSTVIINKQVFDISEGYIKKLKQRLNIIL